MLYQTLQGDVLEDHHQLFHLLFPLLFCTTPSPYPDYSNFGSAGSSGCGGVGSGDVGSGGFAAGSSIGPSSPFTTSSSPQPTMQLLVAIIAAVISSPTIIVLKVTIPVFIFSPMLCKSLQTIGAPLGLCRSDILPDQPTGIGINFIVPHITSNLD